MKTVNDILEYSLEHNLSHIPSALSQFSYLKYILSELKDFKIVIGKPFGAQAYYVIWEDMYKLPKKLGYGIKHEELDFIEYGEETLGNALGVATGIAICQDKHVYCNISDGCLQMGATLEAIQYIGFHKPKILLTIDINEFQLTGKTTDILGTGYDKIRKMFEIYNWNVLDFNENININKIIFPSVILCKTKKGEGVKEMENNPKYWHYKQITKGFLNATTTN